MALVAVFVVVGQGLGDSRRRNPATRPVSGPKGNNGSIGIWQTAESR